MSNSSTSSAIILCAKCGARNRISETATGTPICGRCKTPLSAETHPVTITDANFSAEVENSALPFLIDFWAAWCGPCRMVAPIVDQLARDFRGKARVGKLDVDKNQMTAARFGVQSIPTLLVIKNGREVERIVGAQSKEAIANRLQKHL